jgi:hypothetical protein
VLQNSSIQSIGVVEERVHNILLAMIGTNCEDGNIHDSALFRSRVGTHSKHCRKTQFDPGNDPLGEVKIKRSIAMPGAILSSGYEGARAAKAFEQIANPAESAIRA